MNGGNDLTHLVSSCQSGDRRAASRLISLLESDDRKTASAASNAVARLSLPRQTIGLTGPPGAGKSTLLDYVVSLYRTRGEKVAVLAIDPSSPFTGGALLGDRIRMSSLRNDPGVFIRSMGSRGASGGLAAAASDALRVLGAIFPVVFLETVGAGQAETEVVKLADTVCVAQVPGLGDDVQLMKMGVLEIADVFVVNKGDKPEAEDLKVQLEIAINENKDNVCRVIRQLGRSFAATYKGPSWIPPVVKVSGLHRQNGDAVISALDDHAAFLSQPELRVALQRDRLKREIVWRSARNFQDDTSARLEGGDLATLIDECVNGKVTLDQAVTRALQK